MTPLPPRRRWPEAVLAVALAVAAVWFGGAIRLVAVALLAVLAVFATRRRVWDVPLAAGAALLAIAILAVITLTVDIGSAFGGALKTLVEREGSKYFDRPLHIGHLGIHLASGRVVVEQARIDGLEPEHQPFLTAREIRAGISWRRLLSKREVVVESVEVTDWELLIEDPDGLSNFVRFGSPNRPKRKSPVGLTLGTVRARRGKLSYYDYGSWHAIAPNVDIDVVRAGSEFRGRGSASAGELQIEGYLPMRSDIVASFAIREGRFVVFDRIDLTTDTAVGRLTGTADVRRWPEMTFAIESRLDLFRVREVFFQDATWRSRGEGTFNGSYHLFKGGFRLDGKLAARRLLVDQFEIDDVGGTAVWEPDHFDVTSATARPYGGTARFTYSIKPLNEKPKPATIRFDTCYQNVDLRAFSDGASLTGLRLLGQGDGCHRLEYPSGAFEQLHGDGRIEVRPPPGVTLLARSETPHEAAIRAEPPVIGPEPWLALFPRPTPIGGLVTYRYGPEWVEVDPSRLATDRTHVEFEGRTAYGDRSNFPFYVRSVDWQEGDRVLAGVMTMFGSPTGVITLGGWGEFRGTLLESIGDPRIVGTFSGGGLRAWDVVWGQGTADLVVKNGYADVTRAVVRSGDAEIRAEGRYTLGYPRPDGGEEIDGRITIRDWPLRDLRHAFALDDWPVEGRLSGEYHLTGAYTAPYGFGNASVKDLTAWAEPFDGGTCSLRFEGAGLRVDALDIRKGSGAITGAAYIAWEGKYSFNADGRRIPLESVAAVKFDRAPLSGLIQFTASGSSTTLFPKYDVDGRIDDVFVGDEGIGLVRGHLAYRGTMVTLEVDASSPRLAMSGTGQIDMTTSANANLLFRFTKTSLDPYLRAFNPSFSPFTRAEATGSVKIVGELSDPDRLTVEATADEVALRLFDYDLANEGPVRFVFDRGVLRLGTPAQAASAAQPIVLVGNDTRLELSGSAGLNEGRVDIRAVGDANMAIMQAFYRDIRSSGRVRLVGAMQGQASAPALSGYAEITDGRIRYFGLPHSIQAINGRIGLAATGIQLEDIRAQIAGGAVRLGGRIEMNGLTPGRLGLTATGEGMDFRYPEGFRSVVDAQLDLVGTFSAPTLKGEVTVRSATYRNRIELGQGLLDLAGGRSAPAGGPAGPAGTMPLRYDLHISAPSSLRVDTNLLRLVASADLFLRGTYDRPLLFGRAEVEHGEAIFEGKRYLVTNGTIDFTNPTKIEPFFDIAAETRVRAPGQTYDVDILISGTLNHLQSPQLSSDPPLPPLEIITLLFGDTNRATQDAELRALGADRDRASLATSRVEQALVGTAINPVTSAVERAVGLESFQITPNFFDPYQRVTPAARLTVGKRISDRAYLTFSRSITSPGNDLVVLFEYDQSRRLSWILSRNEDGTYALDARVRHTF